MAADNWRASPIKVLDYISAMRRHLAELETGIDMDGERAASRTAPKQRS